MRKKLIDDKEFMKKFFKLRCSGINSKALAQHMGVSKMSVFRLLKELRSMNKKEFNEFFYEVIEK